MRLWNKRGKWRVNGLGKAGIFYNTASFQRSNAGFITEQFRRWHSEHQYQWERAAARRDHGYRGTLVGKAVESGRTQVGNLCYDG